MNKVDVIIPVHNRPEHTEQTIKSFYEHTDRLLYFLYIIDDCSNKETEKLLEDLNKVYDFTLIRNERNIGPGASRNFVCHLIDNMGSANRYLYHSDNDVYFKSGWLVNLIDMYEDMEKQNMNVKVLGASCHPYLQSSAYLHPNHARAISVGIKDAVSGYSQFMTWDTWREFGPFDETMRGQEKKIMGSEDWAFCQKIIQAGYKVGSLEPEFVVPTGKTNTYGELATGSETFKEEPGVIVR